MMVYKERTVTTDTRLILASKVFDKKTLATLSEVMLWREDVLKQPEVDLSPELLMEHLETPVEEIISRPLYDPEWENSWTASAVEVPERLRRKALADEAHKEVARFLSERPDTWLRVDA